MSDKFCYFFANFSGPPLSQCPNQGPFSGQSVLETDCHFKR